MNVILPLNCAYLYDSIKSNLIIDSILSLIASRYSLEILIFLFGNGAYNNSMSSNYNRIPRPEALLVCNGEAEIIQKRESPIDLLKYDVLPDRFIK